MTELKHAPSCKRCGASKEWYPGNGKKARPQWVCRPCRRATSKKWSIENPERVKAHSDDWYQENKERKAAQSKEWHEDNREYHQALNDQNRKDNPEKTKEYCKRWLEKNPETARARSARRRARLKGAVVDGQAITAAILRTRHALFDGCAYCGVSGQMTTDHFVPLDLGGLHVAQNLVPACGLCNSRKNNNPVEAWFKEQEFFSDQRWERLLEVTQGTGE